MNDENIRLIKEAFEAREKSYAPYSGFRVGAALLTDEGKVYRGCNIENAAYGPSICAERTAIFKAVSDGERHFKAIAVTGGYDGKEMGFAVPCGVCRQVMAEFMNEDSFRIIVAASEQNYREYTLKQLLPDSFWPEKLL